MTRAILIRCWTYRHPSRFCDMISIQYKNRFLSETIDNVKFEWNASMCVDSKNVLVYKLDNFRINFYFKLILYEIYRIFAQIIYLILSYFYFVQDTIFEKLVSCRICRSTRIAKHYEWFWFIVRESLSLSDIYLLISIVRRLVIL